MAVVFEDLVIDRVVEAVFRNSDAEVLGGLTQIQNFSISTSSETKDKTDAQGAIIKRIFQNKTVEVSAENALFSLSLLGLQTGNGKTVGSAASKIQLPMIKKYAKTDSPITLPKTPEEGTLSVCGLTSGGTPDPTLLYEEDTTAGAGKYALAEGVLTLPTDCADYVQVMFEYKEEDAVMVLQSSEAWPKECEATFKVLVYETCDKETLRLAYIVFPAFQMSPDFDITMDTDSAHPFSGTATVDYCSADKSMFYIAMSEDDTEGEDDGE